MNKTLLIERNEALASRMIKWLALERFSIESVPNGQEALNLLRETTYDFVILDSSLEDLAKRAICAYSRSNGGHTAILMLLSQTARGVTESVGADDYLEKPFHPRDLSNRLRALAGEGPESDSTDYGHDPPSGSPVPRRPLLPAGDNQASLDLPEEDFDA
jgi:DNA-binding response OmpR family regulator